MSKTEERGKDILKSLDDAKVKMHELFDILYHLDINLTPFNCWKEFNALNSELDRIGELWIEKISEENETD